MVFMAIHLEFNPAMLYIIYQKYNFAFIIKGLFMKPLVSVIVPVYKVEDYLNRCFNSLCRQSLKDIEILLIDDASPDRCGDICEQYAAKDIRFKVIHHPKNKGLSEARNTGIRLAKADFLMFVDSDDWVHKDFCKDAYKCAMHYQADLVIFLSRRIKNTKSIWDVCYHMHGGSYNNSTTSQQSGYKSRMEAMDLLHQGAGPAAWNKLYRKELFRDISFPPGYLCEDTGTIYKTIWKASSIYFLNKILYYYCPRIDSITMMKTDKYLYDRTELCLQQYHDLAKWGYPPVKLNEVLIRFSLLYCMNKKPDTSDKYYTFFANVLLKNDLIPNNLTKRQKVMLVLYRDYRPLFELLCALYHKKIC